MPRKDKRSSWHRRRRNQDTSQRDLVGSSLINPISNDHISTISDLELRDLQPMITAVMSEDKIHLQVPVLELCLKRILFEMDCSSLRSPRPEQVRTLRRLIFGKADTLLIARTGFGKSLIFHTYSILTRKITLQIIPLSKLGEEQLSDIQKLGYTNPCLITSENKKKEKDLIERFQKCEFIHVLLGPEQASSKTFRDALRDPHLQAQIGLVAIDECHLVKQWREFRAEFTMLYELRAILRQDVVWFGCSRTLDQEAEEVVLQQAGFRPLGCHVYQTEVIRTSINRANISVCFLPIPRGKLSSYKALYFLLDNATVEGAPIPDQIPKTIVFIDSLRKINTLAEYLRQALLDKTISQPSGQQYTIAREKVFCVYDIVQTFTAHVSEYDRDLRYTEFKKPSSATRIMIVTTSLGMGVNIADVEQVVV